MAVDRGDGACGAFTPEERELLRSAGRIGWWERGEALLREGDRADRVILIEQGLVKITSDSESGYTSLLALRGAGELIGELSCLDGGVRSATVTAMQRVAGAVIAVERFTGLLVDNGGLALAVLRSVVARLRDSDGIRADFGSLPGGIRIARTLVGFALRHGGMVKGAAGMRTLEITQQELASAAGTSRETVVRTLRLLQQAELVATVRGRTQILDLRGLMAWAGY